MTALEVIQAELLNCTQGFSVYLGSVFDGNIESYSGTYPIAFIERVSFSDDISPSKKTKSSRRTYSCRVYLLGKTEMAQTYSDQLPVLNQMDNASRELITRVRKNSNVRYVEAVSGSYTLKLTDGTDSGVLIDFTIEMRETFDFCYFGLTPEFTITENLVDFGDVQTGEVSAEQTYTISALNLVDPLVITAPDNFEVSKTTGAGFGSSISYSINEINEMTVTVYLRFAPDAASGGSLSGNIRHETTGVMPQFIPVSGTELIYDPDAIIGFEYGVNVKGQAELSDAQKLAVSNLIVAMKAAGTWTKKRAIYLLVGGTAGWHSVNWKNPGTFDITWVGSPTHNANGVTTNGTNQYGNTNYNPSAQGASMFNFALSVYSRTSGVRNVDFSAFASASSAAEMYIDAGGGGRVQIGGTVVVVAAWANTGGYYTGVRTGATASAGLRNGVVAGSSATSTANTPPNFNVFLGARNNAGTPVSYSARNYAYAEISEGLLTAEVLADYTAIQIYQTALGRQV